MVSFFLRVCWVVGLTLRFAGGRNEQAPPYHEKRRTRMRKMERLQEAGTVGCFEYSPYSLLFPSDIS